MKVGIVVIVYNISAELFCLQIEAIRTFCKDDFEIIVIDNSTEMRPSVAIAYHSKLIGLRYIKTMASSMNGSDSHCWAANLSYQKLKEDFDYFAYFDHDLLPVKPFSILEILGDNKVIAGIGQLKNGITYFWPGILLFKRMDEIDFSVNNTLGLDTGGELRLIIDKYGMDACIFFNEAYHQNPNFVDNKYAYFSVINDEMFWHMVNGSNWNGASRHEERVNSFINLVREKIDSYVE